MEFKDLKMGMTKPELKEHIRQMREIFSHDECAYLVVALCGLLSKQAQGYPKDGVEGFTKKDWEAAERAAQSSLSKLWVALPEDTQKALSAQIHESLGIEIVVRESDDA